MKKFKRVDLTIGPKFPNIETVLADFIKNNSLTPKRIRKIQGTWLADFPKNDYVILYTKKGIYNHGIEGNLGGSGGSEHSSRTYIGEFYKGEEKIILETEASYSQAYTQESCRGLIPGLSHSSWQKSGQPQIRFTREDEHQLWFVVPSKDRTRLTRPKTYSKYEG